MLTVNIVSANPLWGDEDPKHSAQEDSQAIEAYRNIYLDIAIRAQNEYKSRVLRTFEKLYKLGCDHPPLCYRIDLFVALEVRSSGYSLEDQANILFYGPYIWSQMHHHHLSESGARHYICKRLRINTSPLTPLELGQQPAPITAA